MSVQMFREKNIDDLKKELLALLEQRFKLRMQRGAGQKVKTHLFSALRKDIARIKTVLSEKKGES